jgi:hypothetical protein
MLLLGLGIPIGLLYVAKWHAARIPARALLAQSIPVTVENDQVLRDGARFQLRADDLRELVPVPAGGARSLTIAGTDLAVTLGRSPFGAGTVTVTVPGQVAVSSEDGRPGSKSGSTSLPLAVHNHWVLSHDPKDSASAATVLLLIGGEADDRTRRRIVDDVNDRVPELLSRIRSSLPDVPPTPQRSPLDDGGPAPSTSWSLSDPHGEWPTSSGDLTKVGADPVLPVGAPAVPDVEPPRPNGQAKEDGQPWPTPSSFGDWSLEDPNPGPDH